MKNSNAFTFEDALNIQKEQLQEYKNILKKKVHAVLVFWAEEQNKKLIESSDFDPSNGRAVVRGTDLSNFVANYSYTLRREEIESENERFKFQLGQTVHVYRRNKLGDDEDFHGEVEKRWMSNGYEMYVVDGIRCDVSEISKQ